MWASLKLSVPLSWPVDHLMPLQFLFYFLGKMPVTHTKSLSCSTPQEAELSNTLLMKEFFWFICGISAVPWFGGTCGSWAAGGLSEAPVFFRSRYRWLHCSGWTELLPAAEGILLVPGQLIPWSKVIPATPYLLTLRSTISSNSLSIWKYLTSFEHFCGLGISQDEQCWQLATPVSRLRHLQSASSEASSISVLLMASNLTGSGSSCPAQPHLLARQSCGDSSEPKALWGSAEQLLEAGRKPRAGAHAVELEGMWRSLSKRNSEDALRSLLRLSNHSNAQWGTWPARTGALKNVTGKGVKHPFVMVKAWAVRPWESTYSLPSSYAKLGLLGTQYSCCNGCHCDQLKVVKEAVWHQQNPRSKPVFWLLGCLFRNRAGCSLSLSVGDGCLWPSVNHSLAVLRPSLTGAARSYGPSRRDSWSVCGLWVPSLLDSSENCSDNTSWASGGDVDERRFLALKPDGLQLLLHVGSWKLLGLLHLLQILGSSCSFPWCQAGLASGSAVY